MTMFFFLINLYVRTFCAGERHLTRFKWSPVDPSDCKGSGNLAAGDKEVKHVQHVISEIWSFFVRGRDHINTICDNVLLWKVYFCRSLFLRILASHGRREQSWRF